MMTAPGRALVTGATAGIGEEFTRQLAARGYDLVLVARDTARLDALAAELREQHGITAEVLSADLLDPAQLATVEARVRDTARPIDYLVNNAGFGLKGDFHENPVDEEARQLELLAAVPLRLTHAALAQMLPRNAGTILTVASVAGFAGLGSYSAAKSWAITFARWANAFYRSSGVTVSALAPGYVRTEFHERMGVRREAMAPNWMWFDVQTLVRQALRDVDRRKAVSVPTLRYKVIVGALPLLRPIVSLAVSRRARAGRERASRLIRSGRGA